MNRADAEAIAPSILSIGTTEPWNAAGLGLDIRALAACGARALSIVVGVSAQDRRGVRAAHAIPPEIVAAQFSALASAHVAGIRIGALLDEASVASVAAGVRTRLAREPRLPIVYDPVFAPSGGGTFASDATIAAIGRDLVPLAAIVTPNIAEARRLVGDARRSVDADAMAAWGLALVTAGAGAALVTGGHLAGDPIDVYVDRDGEERFVAPRIAGDLRGTGCLLACALVTELARGMAVRPAIEAARAFVRARFASAIETGGMRVAY